MRVILKGAGARTTCRCSPETDVRPTMGVKGGKEVGKGKSFPDSNCFLRVKTTVRKGIGH